MELVEKLRRRRSLVDDHGASFESTPIKHTADGVSVATSSARPSPAPHTVSPSPGMSGQRRNFEEVMRSRKSLTDQSAKTFESNPLLENSIFAEKGLPPSPTRARKSLQPPSMPPPPPPTPAGVGSSGKKDRSNEERHKPDESIRRNILTDFPEESVGSIDAERPTVERRISVSPKNAVMDSRLSPSSIVVYPDQVVWEATIKTGKPVNSPLFHLKGCKWPHCLQFRPKGFEKNGRYEYVLALRGWQPRESQLVVALFAGSETMSQRKWVGPVIDSDFQIEIASDSIETTVTCGFHYRNES